MRRYFSHDEVAKIISDAGRKTTPVAVRRWTYDFPGLTEKVVGRRMIRDDALDLILSGVSLKEAEQRIRSENTSSGDPGR